MRYAAIGAILAIFAAAHAGDTVRSSLQPGERIPSAFHPFNVTGEFAGKKHCLVCENGLNPVVMMFARDLSEPLVQLIAKVDEATAKHRKADMGSFVVFLSNSEALEGKLREVGKKLGLKHTVLSMEAPPGPEDYKVARDAELTVVLYRDHVVQANHAFRKGDFHAKAIERILADLPKILTK